MKKLSKQLAVMAITGCMIVSAIPTTAFAYKSINPVNSSNVQILSADKNHIEYTEKREDGTYFISEQINGSNIISNIYKYDNGIKIPFSTINSHIHNSKVISTEKNVDGTISQYTLSASVDNIYDEKSLDWEYSIGDSLSDIMPVKKTYVRTERYGISLVGKKVTIAIAAGAIVAATAYVNLPVAIKIITAAIGGGTGAGVASLPNYLYVTSDVYRTVGAGMKRYTRWENSYYLDSDRTEYIGSWTFSKRAGH